MEYIIYMTHSVRPIGTGIKTDYVHFNSNSLPQYNFLIFAFKFVSTPLPTKLINIADNKVNVERPVAVTFEVFSIFSS